jgi:hypothetical protein
MSSKNTLAVLSVAALLLTPFGASAAGPAKAEDHAVHHPGGAASTPMPAPGAAMQTAPEMSSMRDMRDKMAAARTPDERQALMAEHMKAMQGGMAMMKEMPGMASMGEGMPPEMARNHQMMMDHKATMQMMMDMMADRLPPATL